MSGAPYWRAGQCIYRMCWPIPNTELRAIGNWLGSEVRLVCHSLRDGTAIGVFGLGRREPDAFTDKHAELVTTFADQAVIAIENARLLSELRECCRKKVPPQMSLSIISRSTFDLGKVLGTLLEFGSTSVRGRKGVVLRSAEGTNYYAAAHYLQTADFY